MNVQPNALVEPLKPRELEVLQLIAEGRTNQEIANQLFVEVTTVRWHNRQIYAKLGVHSRALMIARARELGLLGAGMAQASPQAVASAITPISPQSNLPAQTTSFIGREREIAKSLQLLSAARLLTLTGSGGTGKTRLALQVAGAVTDFYAHGVWFVPLASVHDPRFVPATIASVLKVTETAAESMDASLVKYLRDKEMLLVIDNFEHLIKAASLLSMLLAEAPMLKMIVTSREVLRLYGEQEYQVPPLTMPERGRSYDGQELMNFEAVRLFMARAQASHFAFQATDENIDAVAEICARLDGLPLAIELAAARIKLFAPQQLLSRLASGLGTLSQGPRDAPARQRTLVATIEWSYNLLDAEEKALLNRLTIFQGGWTLEAMEAVCGGDLTFNLFDGLHSLIDKSLVQSATDVGGEPRFRLLETVREYAREHLHLAEVGAIQRRHRDYFLQLAERGEKGLETEEARLWYERLRVEEDNLYGALDWCKQTPGEAEMGLRLAGALWHYWHVRGIFLEGRAWLNFFLQHTTTQRDLARARALNGAGMLAYRQGDYREVARLCGEALAISQTLEENGNAAFALHYLAHVAQEQGNYADAEEMLARSMALYGQEENEWGYAETLNCLGDLHRQLGNYADAARMLDQALALRRKLKDHRGIATTLCNLGHALCRENDPTRAASCFRESLDISQALNNQLMSIMCVLGFAEIAEFQGEPQRLARLLSAANHLLERVGYSLEPPDRANYEWLLKQAHMQLEEDLFHNAWAEGAFMSLAQAITFALSDPAG